ncbi:hypothetical protein PABG_04122 [Paracoccidioides brasiliensis Pb03]|nr:hypothetical protein PABG_04122 [Paracoccidioides brasiliensis Pb03]
MPGEPRTGWTGWATVGYRGLPWLPSAYPGLARLGSDSAGLETYTWYYRGHGNEFVLEYYGIVIPTASPVEPNNVSPLTGLQANNLSVHG